MRVGLSFVRLGLDVIFMASSTPLPTKISTRRRAAGLLVLSLLIALYLLPAPANWLLRQGARVLGYETSLQFAPGFVLGLDLRGGTRLEYEADVSKVPAADRQEALNGVRDVIERRVNSLGVAEPLIQTTQAGDSWRVSVELAGIRDVSEATTLIGKTPILEFKEQSSESPRELTAEEQARIDRENAAAKTKAETLVEALRAPGADFALLARQAASSTVPLPSEFQREKNLDVYNAIRSETASGTLVRVIDTPLRYAVARIDERKQVTKEAMGHHLLISYAGAEGGLSTLTKTQAEAKIRELKGRINPQNFVQLVKEFSMEPSASTTEGSLEWTEEAPVDPTADRFVEAFAKPFFALPKGQISDVVESPFGFHLIYKTDERPVYDIRAQVASFPKLLKEDLLPPADGWKATKLTGKQLQNARVDFNQQTGGIQVALQFNDEGRDLFAEITRRNIGKQVGIFIDSQLISAPTVQSEIPGGQAVITGAGSLEEARELARSLQSGALPVPIQIVGQQTIGASLGTDSLEASLKAGLIGFLLVAIFMIALYRLPGLVAIGALALYAGLSLAVFKFLPVTLTLSGIAGFILSIGIAVDANVLVFERLKEEWRLGKGLSVALEDAFRRAWPSIRDGHVTVLISCAVLYWFSSSVIRGFSLTLAIGVGISLFTAIVTCRVWLRALASTGLAKYGWWFLQPRDLDKKS